MRIELAKRGDEAYGTYMRAVGEVDAELVEHGLGEPVQRLPPPGFGDQVLAHVCSLEAVDCQFTQHVLAELPITVDSGAEPLGWIRVYEGDEAADVAYFFARDHAMESNDVFRKALVDYLCSVDGVSCARKKPRVFSRSPAEVLPSTGIAMAHYPAFEVWEGEEPADAAWAYANAHGLDKTQRAALLAAACADGYTRCTRGDFVLFRFPVTEGDTAKGDIELFEGQLPADAVYDFCRREKYLQPRFTRRRVRATLHASFCQALAAHGRLADPRHNASCAAGPDYHSSFEDNDESIRRAAREALFKTEFAISGLDYKMRYYESDYGSGGGGGGSSSTSGGGGGGGGSSSSSSSSSSSRSSRSPCGAGVDEDEEGSCAAARERRAAEAFCARIIPAAAGCEDALEPVIRAQVRRAEDLRFEPASPFGFDYYRTLRELRDAENATLQAKYVKMVREHIFPGGPVAAVEANVTDANVSHAATLDAQAAARRALAAVKGQRRLADTFVDDAAAALHETREALGALVDDGTNGTTSFAPLDDHHLDVDAARLDAARLAFARLPPTLRAASRVLSDALDDLRRAEALLASSGELLRRAEHSLDTTRPAYDRLEVRSRVLKEAHETFADADRRDANDTPCEPVFGGGCCAKATPGGGKNIKCGGDFSET